MSDLTVCMVNTGTADLLDANWKLTAALNSRMPARWVVVDNTPPAWPGAVSAADPRFVVVPGVPASEAERWNDNTVCGVKFGSFQHGAGLNIALGHATTRWVLFLDPDFCIVVPEWCSVLPAYMAEHGVAFFGAPYHPFMFLKYRYFPTAFCMLVDLDKVPRAHVDFRPTMVPRKPGMRLIEKLFPRLLIGKSKDVGSRIYGRYAASEAVKNVIVQASWRHVPRPPLWRRAVKKLLPDRLVITPKRPDCATELTFRSCGFPDPSALGGLTDEYFWRGEPFGFHIRMRVQQGVAMDRVLQLVASFGTPDVTRRFKHRPATATTPTPRAACGLAPEQR